MKKNSNMIGLDEACLILARHGARPETETVRLIDARNRVLAQDVISKINMPPFDKSAAASASWRSYRLVRFPGKK
jgi:molybdopterin biosynthesis enzyme